MHEQRYFGEVAPGEALPPLSVAVTAAQLFFFSAATYNGHLVHYNEAWSTGTDGHPRLVIHGPLQVALAIRMVTDWIGPRGRLLSYSAQSRGSAYLGDIVHCTATVDRKHAGESGEDGLIDLVLRVAKNAGELLVPGTATVSLPARRAEPPGPRDLDRSDFAGR